MYSVFMTEFCNSLLLRAMSSYI